MDGFTPNVWFPIVTLIIGALLKYIFDVLSDKRTLRREQEARREQRIDALQLKRTELQRSTLLELQEEVTKIAEFVGILHHADLLEGITNTPQKSTWLELRSTDRIYEGLLRPLVNLRKLKPRLLENNVRITLSELDAHCDLILSANNPAAVCGAYLGAGETIKLVHELISSELRKIESLEDSIVDMTMKE
jgi:heme exporter protein D